MSSAGVTVALPQSYFCYQCNRTVTLTPSPNSDLSCPNCSGGFLEEFDSPNFPNPNPNPNPNFFRSSTSDLFSSLLFGSDPFGPIPTSNSGSGPIIITSSSTIDFGNPRNFSPNFSSRQTDDFNPLTFLQSYLNSRGSNFQVIVENHPVDPSFGVPSNLGDYFLGPGLEQLIQQLAENDPNRYGTPPASKEAVKGLVDVVVTDEILKSDFNSCAVCMSEFENGSITKQMPCKHLYHNECLIPWLELHNSCPVCRFELPTDDPDYERRRGSGGGGSSESSGGGGGSGSSGGDGGSQGGGGSGRRFSISLPWSLFGGFRGGNNDRNNNGGSSSGGQQGGGRGGGGSQPNEESLD